MWLQIPYNYSCLETIIEILLLTARQFNFVNKLKENPNEKFSRFLFVFLFFYIKFYFKEINKSQIEIMETIKKAWNNVKNHDTIFFSFCFSILDLNQREVLR